MPPHARDTTAAAAHPRPRTWRPAAQRPHGYARYKLDGCRCYVCGYAVSVYEANRRKQIDAGTWQPFIEDLTEVRAHIEAHARAGVGTRQLARLAGVDRKSVQGVRTGQGRPGGRIQRAVAEKILAVPVAGGQAAPHALIDATGAHRRIHALCAIGWGFGPQAELVGWTRANWHNITCRALIHPTTVALVQAVYDRLSMTTPPTGYATTRTLTTARRHGWLPPLVWDDDTIDDPNAAPLLGLLADGEDADEALVWLAVNGHLEPHELPPAERAVVDRLRREQRTEAAA